MTQPDLRHHTIGTAPNRGDPMTPHQAVLQAVQHEVPNVVTYTLAFNEPEMRQRYRFMPGQFNMLYLPGIGEAAISISSDPIDTGTLEHTIRRAGNVTSAIAALRVGDTLGMRGPFGRPWPVDVAEGNDLIIVAGGIGLPPLRPVIYHVIRHRQRFGQVTILTGARSPADLVYAHQYESWREHDIDVIDTVDRADASWTGNVGVVPMLFYRLRPDPRRTIVFTCGPEIMMRFVIFEALARRIPKDRIFVSLERNMKCGVGFCGHCQLGPLFLCKEGPVLNYQRIESFFGVEEF